MRNITWLKTFCFGSSCWNRSWSTRSSLHCCSASHFRNKDGNPSQPKPKSQSRHWVSKLRECRMEIWSWMRAEGKAVGWEINSIPAVIFFQGQQGAEEAPPETSLTSPASCLAGLVSHTVSQHKWVKHDKTGGNDCYTYVCPPPHPPNTMVEALLLTAFPLATSWLILFDGDKTPQCDSCLKAVVFYIYLLTLSAK